MSQLDQLLEGARQSARVVLGMTKCSTNETQLACAVMDICEAVASLTPPAEAGEPEHVCSDKCIGELQEAVSDAESRAIGLSAKLFASRIERDQLKRQLREASKSYGVVCHERDAAREEVERLKEYVVRLEDAEKAAWRVIEYATNAHVDELTACDATNIPGQFLVHLRIKLRACSPPPVAGGGE